MKQFWPRYIWIILGIAFLVAAAVVLFAISRSDSSAVLDHRATLQNFDPVSAKDCISMEPDAPQFNASKYIQSGDYYTLAALQNDMLYLDDIGLDGEDVLYTALTDELWQHYQASYTGFHPDTLNMFVNWSERLDLFAETDPGHAMFYEPLVYFWMDKVTGSLEENYQADRTLKFNYKFRYVADRCEQMKFGTVIGDKKVEKLMYNIMDRNWSYLWERLSGSTSPLEKGILAFLVLTTLYGYLCIIRFHLKK